jgi:predicted GNAT superfamily acetyltransferase
MKDLADAFSVEHYGHVKDELNETYTHDRLITKQWETEINRRLYG